LDACYRELEGSISEQMETQAALPSDRKGKGQCHRDRVESEALIVWVDAAIHGESDVEALASPSRDTFFLTLIDLDARFLRFLFSSRVSAARLFEICEALDVSLASMSEREMKA
jgi:hypothetical protein